MPTSPRQQTHHSKAETSDDRVFVLCLRFMRVSFFSFFFFFFFQAEDGIRDYKVTGVQTCALPIWFNLAVTSLVAAVAPVLGGWVISRAPAAWGGPLEVYHACFAVQPVIALGGAFLLLRVRETAASPFSAVVGAMRNIRTLGGVS